MKRTLFFLVLVLLLGGTGALAQEVTRFGPKVYQRATAKSGVYKDTFAGKVGPARLEVHNGTEEGTQQVTSATILLNGKQIVGPNNFKQKTFIMQFPIDLMEQNSLSLSMESKPGSCLSLRITQEADPAEPAEEENPTGRRVDPAVTALSLTPDRCNPGDRVALKATVANLGSGRVEAANLSFLVGGTEIARLPVNVLASNSQTELTASFTAQGPGRFPVAARLELTPETKDANTSNNLRLATLRVSGYNTPELEFPRVQLDPDPVRPGQPVRISLTVRNPSFVPVNDVEIRLYLNNMEVPRIMTRASRLWRLVSQAFAEDGGESPSISLAPGAEIVLQYLFGGFGLTSGQNFLRVEVGNPPENLPESSRNYNWFMDAEEEPTVLYPDLPGQYDKWVSMGPTILNNKKVGRINCIAFHPTNHNIVYAGSAFGGLWKTTDGGGSWTPLKDKTAWIGVNAVALDPGNPEIVYCATANPYLTLPDSPILKSIDGGNTWRVFAHNLDNRISKLVVRRVQNQVLIYAAAVSGVYRFRGDPLSPRSNRLDWDNIFPGDQPGQPGAIFDLAVHPTENAVLYASRINGTIDFFGTTITGTVDGLYRTTTAEDSTPAWQNVLDPKVIFNTPGEGWTIKVDLCRSDPQKVFASIRRPTATGLMVMSNFNGGVGTWDHRFDFDDGHIGNTIFRVHADSYKSVYFGDIRFYKATEINGEWQTTQIPDVHYDPKDLVFCPGESYYFFSDDGGIRKGSIDEFHWDKLEPRNFDLRNIQFYHFDVSQSNPNLMLGGTQDQGNIRYRGFLEWEYVYGGDGNYVLIAPSDNQVMYNQHDSLQNLALSESGGDPDSWKNPQLTGLDLSWGYANGDEAYITVDPIIAKTILAQGQEVQYSDNGGENWQQRGPTVADGRTGLVRRVVIDPLWRHWLVGTSERQVWLTKDQGTTWTLLFTHPDPHARVVHMDLAPLGYPYEAVLNVVFDLCSDPSLRVYQFYKDIYEGWQPYNFNNITANLPVKFLNTGNDLHIYCVAGHPNYPLVAYLGTDRGVFQGHFQGGSWVWRAYSEGLPMAEVRQLLTVQQTEELRAATDGRGVWKVLPHNPLSED